jgi:hypothetical protein
MTILQHSVAQAPTSSSYQIARSLRFNSADSASLSRTFGSGGSTTKWTKSIWLKRSTLGDGTNSPGVLFSAGTNSTNDMVCYITASNTLDWFNRASSSMNARKITTQVFRDLSAWQHLLFVWDSANATAASRMLLYVNGVQVTTFSTSTDPSSSLASIWNSAVTHLMMRDTVASGYLSGYLAEIHFIDGQALTPSSFGEIDANTGVWTPKAYSGTFGTTGYYLKLDDNSNITATTLGKDSSGNGNNWTPNNFSVTAGTGNDSLVDSPTNYGTDTGVGGEVRGNYCTWNPLDAPGNSTFANGNLDWTVATAANYGGARGTMAMSFASYFEFTLTSAAGSYAVGVATADAAMTNWTLAGQYTYRNDGNKAINGTSSAYGSTFTQNDVIGVAFDPATGNLTFYKNGTSQGVIASGIASGTNVFPFVVDASGNALAGSANFGQRPFAYTAPSGFKALNTQNLPTPAIGASASTLASKQFNVLTYTGDDSTANATKNRTGLGFQPDLLWIKSRSGAYSHQIYDAIRGVGSTKNLSSNLQNAEGFEANLYGYVSAFSSDGFQTTNGSTSGLFSNQSGATYAAWAWNAGGSSVSNTAGTITSTVRANPTAGISVVTYTGTGANATVGHGLGKAPSMIIFKDRTSGSRTTDQWPVYHASIGATKQLYLSSAGASGTASSVFNDTAPTSSVFSIGTWGGINYSTDNFVAYCFAEVPGFSKFGSYTGNGSTDGPFVYCGFRPRFIMIKNSSASANWTIVDTSRDSYNVAKSRLFPSTSDAENTAADNVDILSNGFKVRVASDTGANTSGNTYIFAAFAEAPFNYARAR